MTVKLFQLLPSTLFALLLNTVPHIAFQKNAAMVFAPNADETLTTAELISEWPIGL